MTFNEEIWLPSFNFSGESELYELYNLSKKDKVTQVFIDPKENLI